MLVCGLILDVRLVGLSECLTETQCSMSLIDTKEHRADQAFPEINVTCETRRPIGGPQMSRKQAAS